VNPSATIDRSRGMVDLPLSDTGNQQADHFGRRIAAKGGVDTVVMDGLERSQHTGAHVLAHNPGARPEIDHGLQPHHQGSLEGQPQEQVRGALKHYADHPNEKIPGVGISGVPGESVNDHSQRAGKAIHGQLRKMKPGEKRLIIGHHSTHRFLRAWVKNGAKPDFSIPPGAMAEDHADDVPAGGIDRLVKKGGKPDLEHDDINSDAPIKPGLNFALHAATPWNAESGKQTILKRLKGPKGAPLS
jgi:broad specificity phosphatase PhoE